MGERQLSCCGVMELTGISDHPHRPGTTLTHLCSRYHVFRRGAGGRILKTVAVVGMRAFYIFTQATADENSGKSYGNRLADYIHKHKLGVVTPSPARRNPNSGNHVTVFTWAVNHSALEKWYNARLREQRRRLKRSSKRG